MSEEKWWPSEDEYPTKITKDDWKQLFTKSSIFTDKSFIFLKRLLHKGGEATCADLAKEYGKTASFYIGVERGLASRIIKEKNLLSISDGKREWKFPVLFLGRHVDRTKDNNLGDYIWKLRPELKEALKDIKLLENEKYPLREKQGKNEWKYLIDEYKKFLKAHKDIAFDGEKYKWELITHCEGKTIPEIIELSRTTNVIDQQYTKQGLDSILKNKPVEFSEQVTKLLQNRETFNEAFLEFKKNIRLLDDGRSVPNDERTASVYLTCFKPKDYTFYKYEYYKNLCYYLCIEEESSGKCYEHYMSLVEDFCNEIEKDSELMTEMQNLTKDYVQSVKLIAQNIIYTAFGNEKSKRFIKNGEGEYEMSKAEELAKLLDHTHNLILHGAPGTGKTYLAREIAHELGASDNEIGFVQFHPSYDYTDFVEGLRPVNDGNSAQIGFERKDGVFKKFCERALQNINGFSEDNFDEAYQQLIDKVEEAEESESPYILKTLSHQKDFALKTNSLQNFYAVPQTETKTHMPITKNNIRTYLRTGEISDWKPYLTAIAQHLIDDFGYKKIDATENKKPFIFIIDEINRGEMSKIFGELFYAIEPSYRGLEKCRDLRTQYANLQTVPNPFDSALDIKDSDNFGHFFIPENVYIIGTMNDIDRNVESMDFAFRRRFTFKEIQAKDTQEQILSSLDDSIREEAIRRMDSLNNAISNIEGLSSAYHIGGAYFLKLNNFEGSAEAKFAQLWNYHLEGLLREYLRGMEDVETNIKKLEEAYNLRNVADSSKEAVDNS